jgi:hypothetical protein
MKWIGLAVSILGSLLLLGWLTQNPRHIPKVLMLIGFLTFGTSTFHLYMAIISWAGWPGYVQGLEFSVMDALALALYLALPKISYSIPFRVPMLLYFTAVVASALQAQEPHAVLFYAWQLGRMSLVCLAVARACTYDTKNALAVLTGMGAGLAMEAVTALWERLGHGVVQAAGTMGHQNLLGLMSHFVVFPAFALALAGRGGFIPLATTVIGMAAEVLTTSRATVGIAAGTYGTLFIISAMRKWTPRKASVLMGAFAALVIIVPIVVSSFEQRFAGQEASDYDERAAFSKAAEAMVSDHPMGVGANNYVLVANTKGYNVRAGVALIQGSLSANVHNVYLLTMAETGYIGAFFLVLSLIILILFTMRHSRRLQKEESGDWLLGLAAALTAVSLHSLFEWVLVTFPAQYLFAVDVGLVTGLTYASITGSVTDKVPNPRTFGTAIQGARSAQRRPDVM